MRRELVDGVLELWPETDAECEISSVEREIGARCFDTDPALASARRQFESATVVSRAFTGVGSFSTLSIPQADPDPYLTRPFGRSVQFTFDSAQSSIDVFFLTDAGLLSAIETISVENERISVDAFANALLGNDPTVQFWDDESTVSKCP